MKNNFVESFKNSTKFVYVVFSQCMDSRILSNSHNASVNIFPIFTHEKQGDFQANRIRPNLICSCFETGLLENLVEEFLSKPIRKKVEWFCGMWGWLARRVAGICARSWLLMLTIFPLHYGVILLRRREVFVGRLVGYLFVKGINHLINDQEHLATFPLPFLPTHHFLHTSLQLPLPTHSFALQP